MDSNLEKLRECERLLYKQLFWSLKRNKHKDKVWAKIEYLYSEIDRLTLLEEAA